MKSKLLFGLVVAALAVAALVPVDADAGGRRGILKVGKREIADGVAKVYDKNGGYADVRVTNVGRRVPKGAGVRIAEDFGMQEIYHGPRDDRTFSERALDQQRNPGPYSAGPQSYEGGAYYEESSATDQYVEEPVCTCPHCGGQFYAGSRAAPSQSFSQSSDFGHSASSR